MQEKVGLEGGTADSISSLLTSPAVSDTQGLHFLSTRQLGIDRDSTSVGTEDCVHSIKMSRWTNQNFVGPSGIGIRITSLKWTVEK